MQMVVGCFFFPSNGLGIFHCSLPLPVAFIFTLPAVLAPKASSLMADPCFLDLKDASFCCSTARFGAASAPNDAASAVFDGV